MGLTMSQWDDLDDYDRSWVLGLDAADAAAAASRCPACGGDAAECQDPDNQHAYEVTLSRCFRSRAINDALRARKDDPDKASLIIRAAVNPAKKKSARLKG